jgi:hypothetical protein
MQKSVLAEIVRSLSKKEIRELNKWMQSPAHNQREDAAALFEYLVKVLPNGDDYIQKERCWKAVFPGKPYDDAFMRQVMYFLLKAIEEYLVFADITNDKAQNQIALARIYRKRKLEKAYKQSSRLAQDHLENQPLRNSYYLLNRFFWEQEEFYHKINSAQKESVNLQEMADALEKWFFTERLLISNDMLAHHKVNQKANYSHGMLGPVIDHIESTGKLEDPTIAGYYYAYKSTINPDDEAFFEKFESIILDKSDDIFNHDELVNFYRNALNYYTSKVNQGNLEYCRKALVFYKKGIDNGVLLQDNLINRYVFGNTIAFALKIGEFEWAENFVEGYKNNLEEKHRDSIVNFNLSRIYFEKGEYDKAQRLLAQFEYDDMLFNIIAKTMLLKIYYETDEYDAFESLLDSLRVYLQRKEALDPARKSAYKNMISLMKKLLSLNIFSKQQKEKYRELIQSTKPLAEKDWLLQQVG